MFSVGLIAKTPPKWVHFPSQMSNMRYIFILIYFLIKFVIKNIMSSYLFEIPCSVALSFLKTFLVVLADYLLVLEGNFKLHCVYVTTSSLSLPSQH